MASRSVLKRKAALHEKARSIRAQILDLQVQLAHVLEQENSLAPIGQLPDDVLGLIFASNVDGDSKIARCRALWRIHHVCRSWRALAKTLPTLWTDVVISRGLAIEMAGAFFKYSQDLPVRVNVAEPRITMVEVAAVVAPQMLRVHSLGIQLPRTMDGTDREWMRSFSQPAPALTYLSLIMPRTDSNIPPDIRGLPMFANATPALRSVSLRDVTYPPSSPLFRNLERLTLTGPQCGITCRALLSVLRDCPDMRTLVVEELVEASGDNPSDVRAQSVPLPLLARASFRYVPPNLPIMLLRPLALAETVALDVRINVYNLPSQDQITLCNLRTALPALNTITRLEETLGAPECVTCCYDDDDDDDDADGSAAPLLRLARWNAGGVSIPPRSVCDPAKLRTYVFRDRTASRTAKPSFVFMTALASLVLETKNMDAVRETLEGLVNDPEMCPALEELELTMAGRREGAPWEALRRLVEGRRKRGAPLARVTVCTAVDGPPPWAADAIRQNVKEFSWRYS